MKIEIERKFLIHAAHLSVADLQNSERLSQGYLSREPVVRVRYAEPPHGHAKGYLTIKGKGQLARAEFEYEIPAGEALEMLELCASRLEKTRYFVTVGKHRWEVDSFHGRLEGLWLAEIELESEQEPFEIPGWLGKEVTQDARYANSSLSTAAFAPVD